MTLALVFVTHIPFVFGARSRILYSFDELSLTFAALDRFLGVPSNVLIWPAGPLQALSVPLYLVDYVIWSGLAPGPESFAAYFSESFREPWRAVALMRLANVLVASGGAAMLARPFGRLLDNRIAGIAAAVCIATVPAYWIHAHTAFLDGLAFGLMCAAIALLLEPRDDLRRPALAGLLTGLALVSKVTVLPLVPFVMVLCLVKRTPRQAIESIATFVGLLIVGCAVGCPYLWTDPVRLAKTVVGNVGRRGTPPGFAQTAYIALGVVPAWFWIGAMLSLVISLFKKRYWLVAGAGVTIIGTLFIVSRSGVVAARYLLPILPVAGVLAVLALADARDWDVLERIPGRVTRYAVVGVLLLATLGNVGMYSAFGPARYDLAPRHEIFDVAADVRTLRPGLSIALPLEVFRCVASSVSSDSMLELARQCGQQEMETGALTSFVSSRGVPPAAVRALPRVFDEEEQAFIAEATVMAYPFDRPGLDVQLWTKAELAPRFGMLSSKDAAQQFLNGELEAVVLYSPIEGIAPFKEYDGKAYLYVRDRQRDPAFSDQAR